jgi:hypothetical protein
VERVKAESFSDTCSEEELAQNRWDVGTRRGENHVHLRCARTNTVDAMIFDILNKKIAINAMKYFKTANSLVFKHLIDCNASRHSCLVLSSKIQFRKSICSVLMICQHLSELVGNDGDGRAVPALSSLNL